MKILVIIVLCFSIVGCVNSLTNTYQYKHGCFINDLQRCYYTSSTYNKFMIVNSDTVKYTIKRIDNKKIISCMKIRGWDIE